MSIYVYGDTHQNISTQALNLWTEKNKSKLSKEDTMIILGDWGGIVYRESRKIRKEESLLRKWVRKPFTLLVQLGNHENYDKIEKLKTIEKFGGKVYEKEVFEYGTYKKIGSIYLMKRGEIYEIEGKTIFSMGGAKTHDPYEGFHWKQELPSKEEYTYAFNKLKSVDFKIDYVITHNCPTFVGDILKKEFKSYGRSIKDTYRLKSKSEDPISRWFNILVFRYKLNFKGWYFGHWHCNYTHLNYHCHYEADPLNIN